MKKILLLINLFLALGTLLNAQNLAPSATASASTCNTGACSTLNDLNLGTCGTQSMWITTSSPPSTVPGTEWLSLTWTSPKSVNKFVIHHAESNNRFMDGGTIQAWNGASWVTVSTFTGLTRQCINTINFPTTFTTSIRITSFIMLTPGQTSNVNFREIEIYGPSFRNDAGISAISKLDVCVPKQKLTADVTNFGLTKLDSVKVNWSVNNTLMPSQNIKPAITTGNKVTVTLDTAFIFSPSTNYSIKVWTSLPNGKSVDSGKTNDTLISKLEYMGVPSLPTITDTKQCGQGNVSLIATPASSRDSILWYAQASGGYPVAVGKNAVGPKITQTTTFYGHSVRIANTRTSFGNTAFGTLSPTQANEYGNMFNISVIKDMVLDSILLRLNYATPTNTGYQLYYKSGTYVGSQTNANAWSRINQGTVTFLTISGASYARISAKNLYLYAGQTYGFYITTDLTLGAGNSFLVTNAAPTVTNEDFSMLTSGSVIIGRFGATSVTANYLPDATFIYKKECVSSSRLPIIVTVKPRPIGASVIKGTTFQGQFKAGTKTNPDVLEINKTSQYELVPPTGYTNTGYGSTWYISSVVARSKYNVIMPSGDYTTAVPTAGSNAVLTFTPKALYLDSTITFSITFSDLGPHFCDSTVTRTIYMAPTPKTNFKKPAFACSGREVLFENTTTLFKGNSTYVWYFDDGDSSDLNTPTHVYKTFGCYNVRLRATTDIWKVVKDTIIQVCVNETPEAGFSVLNKCFGNALSFDNKTTISSGTLNYTWKFGDATSTTTTSKATVFKSYAAAGIYNVTLIANNNGCIDSFSRNAYQYLKPVPNFNVLSGSCSNKPFNFINNSTSTGTNYGNVWNFDDLGNFATDINPSYTYSVGGTKNVKLVVISEFGCKDSIFKPINVNQAPVANFTYPFVCEYTATPFTNTSNLKGGTLTSYTWNFGQGAPSNATSPSVNWTSLGERMVTLKTLLTNGCSDEITKKLTVGVQPIVDFEFNNLCTGTETVFTNFTTYRIGDVNYHWSFDDGTTSTIVSPSHSFSSGKNYAVKLRANVVDGCSDSITKNIAISDLPPTCDFAYARDWNKNPRNFAFTPKGGSATGINYQWIMGDGNTLKSAAAGVDYTYKNDIRYCVTMIASNATGCECRNTKCIDVYTDVDNINKNKFTVYPNPSNGIFNIQMEGQVSELNVEVYNVFGQLVKTFKFTDSLNNSINLSEFNSGVYTLKLISGQNTSTHKINLVK